MNIYDSYGDNMKPCAGRGVFSHFIVGVLGAVIGGILVLSFAPASLLGRIVPGEGKEEGTDQSQSVSYNPALYSQYMLSDIVDKISPSVVGIKTTIIDESVTENSKVENRGSGVIINEDGYIITNNHITEGKSSSILVSLADGRIVPGTVLWNDKNLDISIIKIDADNLVPAEAGNSDNIKTGDAAIAAGSPPEMGTGKVVTSGIISALNCSMQTEGGNFMYGLIKTDADINEYNSGGPLVDAEGKVTGINTKMAGIKEGMGFAIPINIILPVIKALVTKGEFKIPYIGFTGLDREASGAHNIKLNNGIYVYEIDNEGPAYTAGIRKDDIIFEINKSSVNTILDMMQTIFNAGVGNTLEINCKDRFGSTKTVSVELR